MRERDREKRGKGRRMNHRTKMGEIGTVESVEREMRATMLLCGF